MFYVLQNESTAARRRVPILLTDAATGTTAQTGIAITTIFPYVNINGGAFIGGTGSLGEAGFGQYYYEMAPGETSTLGLAGIHITAAGCREYDAIAQIALFNVYSSGGVGITAGDVWNYVLSDTNTAEQDLVSAAAGGAGLTAGDVWDYDLSSYTSTNQAGALLNDTYTKVNTFLDSSISNIPVNVWTTQLTGAYVLNDAGYFLLSVGNGSTGYINAASDVWSYASRTLTSGSGISAFDVWNYTLLSSGQTADLTLGNIDTNVTTIQSNTSNIAGTVWNAQVADYSVNGSYGLRVLRSDQANKNGDVTMYSTGGVNGVDADMHRIANDAGAATALKSLLTGIATTITGNLVGNVTGSVASVVGNVGGNVTGSVGSVVGNVGGSVASVTAPVTVATASMTGIAGTVWTNATRTITGGTITTVSDKTGYSLSATQSFNLTGNITGNLSGSVGSVSGSVASVTNPVSLSGATQSAIANTVWATNISGYTSGSAGYALNTAAGGGVALTAGDIWTYNSRTLTSAAGATAGDVWSYVLSDSNTAGADLVSAASVGSGVSAYDIWNYNIGGITNSGTAGKQLNDAAVSGSVVQIINGPYRLTSTAEGTDGRLDVLQDTVQTVELQLIDVFGSPINIGGNYTLSVDVYDVSGALTTSYTPSIAYAGGGLINFDIDTVVTGVLGRYSIVVSLTDGDVIQVGPLQLLVRPL